MIRAFSCYNSSIQCFLFSLVLLRLSTAMYNNPISEVLSVPVSRSPYLSGPFPLDLPFWDSRPVFKVGCAPHRSNSSWSATAMATRVPLELVDAFLAQIATSLRYNAGSSEAERWDARRALSACALVSSAWRALAQPHQFQDLAVHPVEGSTCTSALHTLIRFV